ncbi:MAG: hypothetical protein J6386_12005 [Candidatus Synoicihabitans palmerolidicus]|nr:hypothetical protein [Candidatus Synoicihabitans palmerolidicus]
MTTWRVSVVVATPSQADYPGLRSLVLVDKTTVRKRDLTESCEQRAYASSLAPAERSPAQMRALIRGHWGGVEIRNHWRRDACWREDHSRTRNVNAPLGQPRPLAQRPAARLRPTLARAAPAARLRILPTFYAYLPARHPFPFLKQKTMPLVVGLGACTIMITPDDPAEMQAAIEDELRRSEKCESQSD